MLVLATTLTGPGSGDWRGYAELYRDQGGWLFDQGRDPGFLYILETANSILGRDGYVRFRTLVEGLFIISAARLAYLMPVQARLGLLTFLSTSLIITAAYCLKGFVQIREGLAFLFILAPLTGIFLGQRSAILTSGLGVVGALAIHSGTVELAATWLAALALLIVPDRTVATQQFQNIALIVGSVAGVAIGISTVSDTFGFRKLLGSYGLNVHVKATWGVLKCLYWLFNGLIAWKVRSDLLKSLVGAGKFASRYGLVLASFIVPVMYAISCTLVFMKFPYPALTSIVIRMFLTVTELGMIVISLRGRANLISILIAAFMVGDRLRIAADST